MIDPRNEVPAPQPPEQPVPEPPDAPQPDPKGPEVPEEDSAPQLAPSAG